MGIQVVRRTSRPRGCGTASDPPLRQRMAGPAARSRGAGSVPERRHCVSRPGRLEDLCPDAGAPRTRHLRPGLHRHTRKLRARRIHGFSIATGEVQHATIGDHDIEIRGARDTYGLFGTGTGAAAESLSGYGLILQTGDDEFTVVARHASLTFPHPDALVELDALREGTYAHGEWTPGRTLNGDERYFAFQSEALRGVRISLLRRAR